MSVTNCGMPRLNPPRNFSLLLPGKSFRFPAYDALFFFETAFPWLLFISLCIHSFLEGFPIHQHNDMVYGVFIHKMPIAALLTTYLLLSDFSKLQIGAFLVVFASMTPLGTAISNNIDLVSGYIYYINAIVIGIFFHISTIILFESSEGHKFNLSKLIVIVLGVIVAFLI